MSKMNGNIKNDLIKSVKAIKQKVKWLREREDDLELQRCKLFKPITNSIQSLAQPQTVKYENTNENYGNEDFNIKQQKEMDEPLEIKSPNKIPITSENIKTPLDLKNNELCVPFGVRNDNGKLMIGNTLVTFTDAVNDSSNKIEMVKIGENSYEVTPGLRELLFQSKPNLKIISDKDKLVYKDILSFTNVHKRDYHSSGQIKGDKGMKYCHVIKPLIFENNCKENKTGGNLLTLKSYKKNTDFIYWDDPNELVERLKILIASKDAGNTSHDNEIISIIEELKEAGIIKK